jgi:hypothetical protein
MSGRRTSAAEGLSNLHRIARRQLSLVEEGEWEEILALMDERMDISASVGEPLPDVLRPLRELCLMIDRLNSELEQKLVEGRTAVLRQMARLHRSRRTIGAYHPPDIPEYPRYLDEKK